jgi:hypothetical protein
LKRGTVQDTKKKIIQKQRKEAEEEEEEEEIGEEEVGKRKDKKVKQTFLVPATEVQESGNVVSLVPVSTKIHAQDKIMDSNLGLPWEGCQLSWLRDPAGLNKIQALEEEVIHFERQWKVLGRGQHGAAKITIVRKNFQFSHRCS